MTAQPETAQPAGQPAAQPEAAQPAVQAPAQAAVQDGTGAMGRPAGAVALDFDGVLHSYERGWADGTIYGQLPPGAGDALAAIARAHPVVVFTTRPLEETADWLAERTPFTYLADSGDVDPGYPFWNRRDAILVTHRKYAAVCYVDDRAVYFTGWARALADVRERTGSALQVPPGLAFEQADPAGAGPLAGLDAEQAAATREQAWHAARAEWERRYDEQIVASPGEHADAIADAVLAGLGLAAR